MIADAFNMQFRGAWTPDELLVHPCDAAKFCDDFRHAHGYYDLPDDAILRGLLQRRKNP